MSKVKMLQGWKGVKRVNPLAYLTNKKNIRLAALDCLQQDDFEGVVEVLETYFDAAQEVEGDQKEESSPASFSKNPF